MCGILNRYPQIQNLKNLSIILLTRVPLLQTLGYEMKALETGSSFHGGSAGQPGVGSSTGDFERWLKGTLEVGHLSLLELCDRNLEGGHLCWVPWRIGRKSSGDASVSIGDPLGNLEGGLSTGDFER